MLGIKFFDFTKLLVIAAYIALITFLPSVDFMPNYIYFHDSQRLLELLLLALVLFHSVLLRFNISKLTPLKKKSLQYSFYLLLAFSFISVILAKSPRHAAIEVSIFAGLSYLTLYIVNLFNENKALLIKSLSFILWASVTLYLFAFYVGYFSAIASNTPLHWPSPFTGFNNIRSFNQYQLWPIAFITLPLLTFNLKKIYSFGCTLHFHVGGYYYSTRLLVAFWWLGWLE
ncbi:MAG: hypothetical protein HOP06_04215 [Methylotenera sp.]|nr:hypothetical protein [Methylotenera sp.]